MMCVVEAKWGRLWSVRITWHSCELQWPTMHSIFIYYILYIYYFIIFYLYFLYYIFYQQVVFNIIFSPLFLFPWAVWLLWPVKGTLMEAELPVCTQLPWSRGLKASCLHTKEKPLGVHFHRPLVCFWTGRRAQNLKWDLDKSNKNNLVCWSHCDL